MSNQPSDRRVLCDIARCAFEVVNRLLSRDQVLAQELRSKTATSRQIFREECITLDMVSTLRERFPQHVEVTLFTAPEEKRNGADWYWRFERDGRAIHARVQAKRVQRTEFGQSDDRGFVDIDRDQLHTLIASAKSDSIAFPNLRCWLATYARFNATPPCGKDQLWNCNEHNHGNRCADHESSVWIANAEEFRTTSSSRLEIRDVVEKSVRLDCILPCIDESSNSGPARKQFILNPGLPSHENCVAAIQQSPRLRTEFEGAMRITL